VFFNFILAQLALQYLIARKLRKMSVAAWLKHARWNNQCSLLLCFGKKAAGSITWVGFFVVVVCLFIFCYGYFCCRHMMLLKEQYGKQVIVNLLGSRGGEEVLNRAFKVKATRVVVVVIIFVKLLTS